MTSVQFCYWLQSAFELMKAQTFNKEQTQIIKNHLAMVFHHEIDPSYGDAEHQGNLNEIHNQGMVKSRKTPKLPASAPVFPEYIGLKKWNDIPQINC